MEVVPLWVLLNHREGPSDSSSIQLTTKGDAARILTQGGIGMGLYLYCQGVHGAFGRESDGIEYFGPGNHL